MHVQKNHNKRIADQLSFDPFASFMLQDLAKVVFLADTALSLQACYT